MSTGRTADVLGFAGLALTLLGTGTSIYLTVAHYSSSTVLACPDRGTINCAKVTTSSYSTQFGVPLVIFGLVFFAATLAVQNPLAWRSPSRRVRGTRVVLAAGGAAAALWLIWVELFRLDAICLWCTVVHVVAILLFMLTGLGTAATVDA
jgi:uncharacterized membrane protein